MSMWGFIKLLKVKMVADVRHARYFIIIFPLALFIKTHTKCVSTHDSSPPLSATATATASDRIGVRHKYYSTSRTKRTPSRINLDRVPFSAVLSGHCRHRRPPACYWQPGLAALAPPACSRLLDRGACRGRHYPAHPSAAPSPAEIRAPSRLPYPCSGSGASRSRIVAPTCPAPRTRAAGGEASQLVRAALGQTEGKRGAARRPTHGGSLLRLSGIL